MSQMRDANGDNGPVRPSNQAALSEGRDKVSLREVDTAQLAALIDGTIDPAARSALVERIAASEGDSDVLSDALGALEDLGTTAPISIAARRRPAPVGRWIAIAASIAIIATIAAVWVRQRGESTSSPTRYAINLAANGIAIPPAWNDSPWTSSRGYASLGPEASAVRLGSRLTDLEIAVRSNDTSAARFALSAAALIDEMPVGAPIASMYRGVAARAGAPRSQMIAALDSASAAVSRLPDAPMIGAGAWIEAARLAATSRNMAFFNAHETRVMIDYLGESPTLSRMTRTQAATVRSMLTVAGERDWSVVSAQLTKLLESAASDDASSAG